MDIYFPLDHHHLRGNLSQMTEVYKIFKGMDKVNFDQSVYELRTLELDKYTFKLFKRPCIT